MESNNSGVNTVLLVIILLAVVAGGIWWYRGSAVSDRGSSDSLEVDVNLPTGEGQQN